jgi:nucleotide-binding universal stress UspA family protein
MDFKKIVVAVDFVEESLRVLEKIKTITFPGHAEFHLLHAFELFPSRVDFIASYLPGTNQLNEISELFSEKLTELIPRFGFSVLSNLKVKCLVSHNARQDFLNYTNEIGADLIITASQEKSFVKGLFEGSFGGFLNKYSKASLLVLRPTVIS